MSTPILWIVVPGVIAFVLIFLLRRRTISMIVAILTALILSGLAWWLEVGEVITFGPWAFKIQEQLTVAGRSFVISNLDRPQVALFYIVLAFWFIGALGISTPPLFIPLGLASVAIWIAALAVQPILYAALLIEVAVLLSVLMLTPIGKSVNRGVLRFLTYQTLGVPFILLAGWFLSGIEVEAGNTQDIVRAAIFLGFGFAFHLGIFPLHGWIPMLTETAHPYVTAFVISTMISIGVLFPVGFMQRYPSLYEEIDLLDIFRFLGILMVLVGGAWAAFQRHLGRILGFAMILETGRTFLTIGLPEGDQMLFALYIPRILALGVWAFSLSNLKAHSEDLRFHAVQGLGRKYPIIGAGLVLAQFSLVGIPLLGGFPTYLILWEQSAVYGVWISLGAVLGSAGLLIGGLRSLAVLVMGPEEVSGPQDDRGRIFSNIIILLGVSAMFIIGIFPQWFVPALTSISGTFGSLTP